MAANVKVELTGEYAGRWAEFRGDISARILIDLNSDDLATKYAAFSRMIVDHNLPDLDGKPAVDLLDVPVKMLDAAAGAYAEGALQLPKA